MCCCATGGGFCGANWLTGFLLGCILAAVGMARVFLWQCFTLPGRMVRSAIIAMLSLTIGVSLVGVVLWGSLVGAMLPIFLRVDPA